MQQKTFSLLHAKQSLVPRKPVSNNCFGVIGPKASSALAIVKTEAYFHSKPLLSMQILRLLFFFNRRYSVSQDQNPLNQMVLADLPDGTPEKRHFHAGAATDIRDQDPQNCVGHGLQDSQSPGQPGC